MRARDNPFRMERVLAWRYRLPQTTSWPDLLERLRALRFRGAIVGPHGCGKTTLLEDLCARLQDAGQCVHGQRINAESASRSGTLLAGMQRTVPREAVVVIDGAEQIGWLQWKRLIHRARLWRGLIITTHQEGRLPTLFHCQPRFDILEAMVRDLAPGLPETLTRRLPELYQEHQGNLRICLRALYDEVAQTLTAPT